MFYDSRYQVSRGYRIVIVVFPSYGKCSTCEVLGHQNFELNFISFAFLLSANLSIVKGPHKLLRYIVMEKGISSLPVVEVVRFT